MEKLPKITAALLDIANRAYHDGAGMINVECREGERGDLLAYFIRQEIIDAVFESDEEQYPVEARRCAINYLEVAIRELTSVVAALETDD